jgi:hypothetical protein
MLAGASRSQRKDMIVDLCRVEVLELVMIPSSGHGEPLV